MAYRPAFPARFASIEAARAFCQEFFRWYNTQHRHRGISLHTPEAIHYGFASKRQLVRAETLPAAYGAHPERFVRKPPTPPAIPSAAWISEPLAPTKEDADVTAEHLP